MTVQGLKAEELEAQTTNFPNWIDIVRLGRRFKPLDGELKKFIEEMCRLCGWNTEYTLERIDKERR